jgi:hypothetical protein
MIKYSNLGQHKQLNEIVMAGSHDAGVTEGGANVQTQNMDIYLQAYAGVRLFDIRIAGQSVADRGVGKEAQLKAYHSAIKFSSTKTRQLTDLGKTGTATVSKLAGGDWGMGLTRMLREAKKFVEQNPEEFLILKFDKCGNWTAIAETCIRFLGNAIYSGAGNVNCRTLGELCGKVIVLFGTSGLEEIRPIYPAAMGILGFKNLAAKGSSYDPNYDGLQYLGKGGTDVWKPLFKIDQNKAKQEDLMKKGGDANPNVMGMMYWTTTGLFESIKKRDQTMWTDNKSSALRKLWSNGLADSIESRLAKNVDPREPASGGVLKAFMPNFVMIDFADAEKCQTIYELNSVAATALTSAARVADQKFGNRVRFV